MMEVRVQPHIHHGPRRMVAATSALLKRRSSLAPATLVLSLLGLVLAFGVRTPAARRRTGGTGFRRPGTTAFTAP